MDDSAVDPVVEPGAVRGACFDQVVVFAHDSAAEDVL